MRFVVELGPDGPGAHTIHFGTIDNGTPADTSDDFSLDVTYNLDVE